MDLSQPSASLLIKSLEKDLGIQLFERHGPKIIPSSYGTSLYQLAQPAVETMDSLPERFLASIGEINSGKIDIAADQSTILYLLPKYITAFHEDYNKVKIQLHDSSDKRGLELLRSGEVDFMVDSLNDIPDDIDYKPILSYRTMLITPTDHPLTQQHEISLEDIARYGLILPSRDSSSHNEVRQLFKQHNLEYQIVLETRGWEIIKKYVSMNMGISIVTELCLTGEDNLTEIALDHYFPSRSYGIIQRKGNVYSPQAKLFIKSMDKHFFD